MPLSDEGALLRASKAFAVEDRARTWRLLLSTLLLQGLAMSATVLAPLALKPVLALVVAGIMIRLFIFLHDAEHGAIFRGDPLGRAFIWLIGVYTLSPPPVWHIHHHRHHRTNGALLGLPLSRYLPGDLIARAVTIEQWRELPPKDRALVRFVQHPVMVALSLVTAFAFSHCLAPPVRNLRTGWTGPVVLALWLAAFAGLGLTVGWTNAVFVWALPNAMGSAVGVYLFLAQHRFREARLPRAASHVEHFVTASLEASSFFEMPRWMHWFTGNIGYHHVHHLNPHIPFYRLPEAMAAIPELRDPPRTYWRWSEVVGCFRANVWDLETGRLVSFAEAD